MRRGGWKEERAMEQNARGMEIIKKYIYTYFYTPKHSAARSIEAVGLRLCKEAPERIQHQAAGCKIQKHHTGWGQGAYANIC